MNHNYIILTSLALSLSASTFAQSAKDSVMHKTLTIERNFSPIVRDANKIDQQPEVSEVKFKKSPTRYSDWVAGEALSSEVGKMNVGQVIAVEEKYRNGYFEVSGGNYINGDLKAGVNLGKNVAIDLDGFLTEGELDIINDRFIHPVSLDADGNSTYPKWDSHLMNLNGKISFDHCTLRDTHLRAHIYAGGRNYNMFRNVTGDNNIVPEQKMMRFGADASIESGNFFFGLNFNHSDIKLPDVSDNRLGAVLSMAKDNGDSRLKGTAKVDVTFNSNNIFNFLPEVEYSRFNDLSRFYASVAGGLISRDLYEVMSDMPLLLPKDYKAEKRLFDATIGYEDNNHGKFHWGIFAGASMTFDRMDALMAFSDSDEATNILPANYTGTLYGEVTQTDEFDVKGGLYIDVEGSRFFGLKAGAVFESNPTFGAPKLSGNFHINLNPIHQLSFDLGIDTGIKREMKFLTEYIFEETEVNTIDLGDIIDLNARIDFKPLPNLSIFVFGKNLLSTEYMLWAGVPAQKINIHAGFQWHF